MFLIVKPFT